MITYIHRSRQNVIKNHTIEWIEKHYGGLFQEIHFGNHFALDGQSIPKSEICRCVFFHLFVQHELFRGFAVNNFYLIHEAKMIFEVS